jgi:acyl-CoA dehydrogenase
VPVDLGGMGLTVAQVAKICEVLGRYCGSTAMVFAMHQLQVACVVHHATGSAFFCDYLRQIDQRQLLFASATSEVGIGGDVRSSICSLETHPLGFALEKQASVISYAEAADAIFVTCRRAPTSARSDQVMVMVQRSDYELKRISDWDTLGFRGTCSPGYALSARGPLHQVLPCPYSEIHSATMHPVAHILWGSVWLGLASDALDRARFGVRAEAKKNLGVIPISATRLAEAETLLFAMRSAIYETTTEYQRLLDADDRTAFESLGFVARVNNLKLLCSQLVVDIVGRAMMIGGINSYKNNSEVSLGRHLRDAYGAALMVNNERILGHNAMIQIVLGEA